MPRVASEKLDTADSVTDASRMPYRISVLDSSEDSRWDRFVESCPEGTFFHLSGWRKIIESALGHPTFYLSCEVDDEIKGVLPLAHVKSTLFGNQLTSLPFLVYGGPLFTDCEAERALVEAAIEKARELRVDGLEFRSRFPSERAWIAKPKYATFRKELNPDPQKNLLAIPRKQRAMIRKGIKAGLTAQWDIDTSRLYEAMLSCKRNLGTPFFGENYLQTICETFKEKAQILTVCKDSKTVCSVMSFAFRDEILPYYGGGGDIARNLKGNDFMYWKLMEHAASQGVRVFDYGRSMVGSGAYRFKRHWGFEPEPLAYEYFPVEKKEVPSVDPANPRYRLLINAWKRLPLPVAGRLGPPLARRLG